MTSETTQPPTASWLTRRRFRLWLIVGVVAVFVALVTAVYLNYVRDVPLVISRETTYITSLLTADGTRVDYFAAAEQLVYPPEMATDDNGYRMIAWHLGVSPDNSPEVCREICEKLGVDTFVTPTLTYQEPYSFLQEFAKVEEAAGNLPADTNTRTFGEQLHTRLSEPWTVDELPMLQTWLEQNGPALDLVGEAVRKPVFRVPWAKPDDNLLMVLLNDIQRMRTFARGLTARARYRIATGDLDGAMDDIVACATLGRQLERGGFVIEDLVGISCEAVAFAVGPGESLRHQPTEQQWQRFIDELNQLPERAPIDLTYEIERLVYLDTIQSLAFQPARFIPDDVEELVNDRTYGLDWSIVMEVANTRWDDYLSGSPIASPDLSEMKGFMSRGHRSELLGEFIASAIFPATRQHEEARRRSTCKENLLRITIAMLLYEKQHGTLPPAYSVDEQGQPLHSWRVLLLPYLGYDELYAQLRLDEPWDSPHNQAFHTTDVPIFQCPSAALSPGMTEYSVVEGPMCAFSGSEGKRLDSFGEQSANLILVVERVDPVCWMDPTQELSHAQASAGINTGSSGLGSEHTGGMHIGLRSGAVRFISANISTDLLLKLLDGTIDEPY